MLSDIKDMLDRIAEIWDNLSFLLAGFWLIVKDSIMFSVRVIIFFALCITSPVWVWFYLARRNK